MSFVKPKVHNIVSALIFLFILSACSIDAEIVQSTAKSSNSNDTLPAIENRTEVDFVNAETYVTPSGIVVRGGFGELSEKLLLSNGNKFEGIFND